MMQHEAAEIAKWLVGQYPGTYFDGSMAESYVNSLQTMDRDAVEAAVHDWVQVKNIDRFPTIPELNAHVRTMRQHEDMSRALPSTPFRKPSKQEAFDAFMSGYTRARSEAGDDLETIRKNGAAYFERAWAGDVSL